jgi:putative sigma-54 modulation protein
MISGEKLIVSNKHSFSGAINFSVRNHMRSESLSKIILKYNHMNIKIKATRLELTDAIRAYCQTKMDMLEKYFGDIQVLNCDVEVERILGDQHKGDIFRAEVNIEVPKEILRVEKSEKDLYKAIDKVKDHMAEMIKKYKEKLIEKR